MGKGNRYNKCLNEFQFGNTIPMVQDMVVVICFDTLYYEVTIRYY